MTPSKALKGAALASALSFLAVLPAQSETRAECYATIHDECYPPGQPPRCSSEDYNQWLTDFCDSIESSGANNQLTSADSNPPPPPRNLKLTTSDPDILQTLKKLVGR